MSVNEGGSATSGAITQRPKRHLAKYELLNSWEIPGRYLGAEEVCSRALSRSWLILLE